MRAKLMWLSAAALLVLISVGQAADVTNATPIGVKSMGLNIGDFVALNGQVDLEALKAGGYQGSFDLKGVDVRIDSKSGEPTVHISSPQAPVDHPDDIYWDNSVSSSFAGVGGEVSASIVYDGKLVIGGGFRVAGDQIVNYIAMWDGSTWSPLASGMDGPVRALAVYDGKLIAGGDFTVAGGMDVNNIASWDGATWSPLGSGADIRVDALTLFNGKLVAAGVFSVIGGMEALSLASWDGSSWSRLAITNGSVWALAVFDGKLIAGGKFTEIGGVAAKRIACWDGSNWTPIGLGVEGSNVPYVSSLAVYDGQLIAGGYFHTAGEIAALNIASWDGAVWSPVGSGTDGYVKALHVYDGNLVAGGWFYRASGIFVYGIASWNGSTWSAIGTGLSGRVESITEHNGRLIVGGIFSEAGETPAKCIAAWDGSNWSSLSSGINLFIRALAVFDGKLIAGGSFASIGDILANRVASWDGTKWEALGSGMSSAPGWSSSIDALTIYDGSLIAGGAFFYADGIPVNRVASWNGSGWSPMGEGPGGPVMALTVLDGVLYAGGGDNVSSWDGAGWTQLGSDFDGFVYAIAEYGGKLVAGGWFEYVGGMEVNCIASWDGTIWSPMGSGLTGSGDGTKVTCLAVYDDLLMAGGQFRTAGGVTVDDLACWDGSKWLPIAGWKGTNTVNAMLVYNGKLIVGGSFFTAYGSPGNYIAAWDGATWSELGSGVDNAVLSLTPFGEKLVVGGGFRIAGNKVAASLAMWTKPLTTTVELDIKPGSCPNPFNLKGNLSKGKAKLPAAILGTADFDVHDIDPTSLELLGVAPLRWGYEDVTAPVSEPEDSCDCTEAGPDGFEDLTLKFDKAAIADALNELDLKAEMTLAITGMMYDSTYIEGSDCIKVLSREKLAGNMEGEFELPEGVALGNNYPNPFNPLTNISFSLAQESVVKLEIFNVMGQKVTTLVYDHLEAGEHTVQWDGRDAASGVYLYRLQAGDFVETRKMLLLK